MTKNLSKLGTALVFAVTFFFGRLPLALAVETPVPSVRIATVDMNAAIQATDKGKKARESLEKKFNAKKKELQDEEAAIKKLGEEFRKQSVALSEEARQKKGAAIQERIAKLQESTMKSQNEIQKEQQELLDPIIKNLRTVISDVAKERNYTLVLEKNENSVLYSLEKDDLTADVIAKSNKK